MCVFVVGSCLLFSWWQSPCASSAFSSLMVQTHNSSSRSNQLAFCDVLLMVMPITCLQCFDTVGLASGTASGP